MDLPCYVETESGIGVGFERFLELQVGDRVFNIATFGFLLGI